MLVTVLVMAVAGAGGYLALRSSGLVQPSHWKPPPKALPVVSTRGNLHRGQLAPGRDAYGYRVEGALPGYAAGSTPPSDLLLVIHGFNNTAKKAQYKFGLAAEGLERGGYRGVVAGYSWDADTQRDPLAMTGYHEGLRHAQANGAMLARFIVDYKKRCPQTRVHLLGYSMGARLALESLLALQQDPQCAYPGVAVSSVHLVGAAVENEEVEQGRRFGGAIAQECGALYNYFSPEDNKLTYYFPLKEGDRALGTTGIEHPDKQPGNYIGVNAQHELPKLSDSGKIDEDEYGDNHSGYLGTRDAAGKLIDDGVMDLIAGNIAAPPVQP
jgi:pimeloyl-ACP methyl ester carboxylesterase